MPTPADYERLQMSADAPPTHHFPSIERTWTIGTVIAAVGSVVTVVTVIVGLVWGYAGVSYATEQIPTLKQAQDMQRQQQEVDIRDISNLKLEVHYGESQNSEILSQLNIINSKIDRLNQNKVDKSERR